MKWQNCFSKGRVLPGVFKKRHLLLRAVALSDSFDNGARVDALVDVEGDCWDFKKGVFGFSCPDERGVKVRVVCVGLFAAVVVCVGGYETDGRVVAALLSFMVVLLDGFFIRLAGSGHYSYLYYCEYLLIYSLKNPTTPVNHSDAEMETY